MKVIVVILRGLHLGYVGCYGNAWIDTPGLDRLAAEGVVFDWHYAECPDGAAARRAWRGGGWAAASHPSTDLLTLLRGRGVATHLVLDDAHSLPDAFADGWDQAHRLTPDKDCGFLEKFLKAGRRVLDDLADQEHGLLWFDLANLLPPWQISADFLDPYFQPPAADDEEEEIETLEPLLDPAPGPLPPPTNESFLRLQSTFAGAVSYVDSTVGWLLDELQERQLAAQTLLVVTSDHGQALGEHGIIGPYRPWLHDELIHVPLLMRLPGGAEAGRRVAALTQCSDLFPTLLDVFDITAPPSLGYSLLALARGQTEQVRSHVCCAFRLGEREEWVLRAKAWSILLPVAAPDEEPTRTPQLFVKPEDRWEVNNVWQHYPDLAERMEQALRAFMAAPRRIGLEKPWETETEGTVA
jgi:arylsulfatase A-like enzyme